MSCMLENNERAQRVRHLLGVRSDMQVTRALAEIGVEVDHNTVRKWRIGLGIQAAGSRNTGIRYRANAVEVSDAMLARWARDRAAGYTLASIAEGSGVKVTTVRRLLAEYDTRAQAGADERGPASG